MLMTPESLDKCKQDYMRPCNNYCEEWSKSNSILHDSKRKSPLNDIPVPVFARDTGSDGWIGLMCPECFNVVSRRLHYTSSVLVENAYFDEENPEMMIHSDIKFIQKKCEKCGNEYFEPIQLDYNIAETISLLNKAGYRTKYCCEGHGNKNTYAYIMFGNSCIMKHLNTLPITWEIDLDSLKNSLKITYCKHIVIRSEACNYEEAIMDIYEWALNIYKLETEEYFKET